MITKAAKPNYYNVLDLQKGSMPLNILHLMSIIRLVSIDC